MDWLHAETQRHSPLTPTQNRTLLHAILVEFVRLWRHAGTGLVEATRRYVRRNIAEPIALDDLADRAGMSKYHFVRRYKSLTGRTPMEDTRVMRVEYARSLILTTSLPLKAVAPRAGLGDQYHMSRLFRRYLDMTPGEIRATVKDGK